MSADLRDAVAEFQRCIDERDRASAEQILDPAYALVLVAPAGAVMPRRRWLEVLEEYVVHDYEVEEQVVDRRRVGLAMGRAARGSRTPR